MKTILIIEDDPITAHIYRTRLANETYTVETCNDGQSALDRVHELNPDAILLDLMLSGMNGIDILKKIRAQIKFATVPIVVFSNAYLPDMIKQASSAGVSQIFNKASLTPPQLLDSLNVLLLGKNSINPCTFGLAANSLPEHPGSPPPPSNYGYNHDHKGSWLAQARLGSASSLGKIVDADDSIVDAELYKGLVGTKTQTLAELRRLLQQLIKTTDDAARELALLELYRKIHALTSSAGLAKCADIAEMASALEVLLKDLTEQPKHINVSTLRTVVQTIDFIGELFNICEPRCGDPPPPNILVVDDEVLSRRAIVYALERGNLKSTSLEDPIVALKMLTEERFDLILLDVKMPAVDGFELCTKIRALPTNQNTPVLFVTSLTDFKSRAKSTLSGGTDFIAKPFVFIELTVKALTLILRNRLFPKMKAA